MKKKIVSCLSVLLLFSGIGSAYADSKKDTFTVTPFVGGYVFEDAQPVKNKPVYGIRAGYNMTEHLGTEAVFDWTPTDGGISHTESNFYNYHLDLLYHFLPKEQWVPFLVGGIGMITDDGYPHHFDRLALNYGAGVEYAMTENTRLRGEVRGIHYQYTNQNYENLEFGVGLGFTFDRPKPGKRSARMPEGLSRYFYDDESQYAPVLPQPAAVPVKAEPVCPPPPAPVVIAAPPEPPREVVVVTPPRPVCVLVASSNSILVGQSVKLDWHCSGTDATVIRPGIGEVASKGSVTVSPDISTKYQITGSNASASTTESTTIKVTMPAHEQHSISLHVLFDTGKWEIKPEFEPELEHAAAFLKEFPEVKGNIKGYTDSVGGKQMNLQLSKHRSEAVVDALVNKYGISRARLTSTGYGLSNPIADNKTPQGREQNRRTIATFQSK